MGAPVLFELQEPFSTRRAPQSLSTSSLSASAAIPTCMAANLQGKRAIGLGKQLRNQIWAVAAAGRDPAPLAPPLACSAARAISVHTSAYDKNPDDQVRPSAVPDDVIQLQSEKYWGPHPTTGVFGPADLNGHPDPASTATPQNRGSSVLDQTAWFRPLEDVDNPPHA